MEFVDLWYFILLKGRDVWLIVGINFGFGFGNLIVYCFRYFSFKNIRNNLLYFCLKDVMMMRSIWFGLV